MPPSSPSVCENLSRFGAILTGTSQKTGGNWGPAPSAAGYCLFQCRRRSRSSGGSTLRQDTEAKEAGTHMGSTKIFFLPTLMKILKSLGLKKTSKYIFRELRLLDHPRPVPVGHHAPCLLPPPLQTSGCGAAFQRRSIARVSASSMSSADWELVPQGRLYGLMYQSPGP